MIITLVAMTVIVLAGVGVMAVATVAHVLARSRRLRQRLRAQFVSVAAWTYRVRREMGRRLERLGGGAGRGRVVGGSPSRH